MKSISASPTAMSGIHDFRRLEAGFPTRIASGMTLPNTGGRLVLLRYSNNRNIQFSGPIPVLHRLIFLLYSGHNSLWKLLLSGINPVLRLQVVHYFPAQN